MSTKLFYNVDKNSTEEFKNDTVSKTSIGIVNANEGEPFGYLISYNSQLTPSYNDINDIIDNYMTINQWNEKKQTIERLAKNIHDLGVVENSGVAETNAGNANICTNKDILIIKYTVNDGRVGTIYQNVTNRATYQYIECDGFLKYRKLTWMPDWNGTLSVTGRTNWTPLFNAGNGNLFANGTLIELSKYVTTNSEQTITGKKTFTNDVIINNKTAIKGSIDPGELKVLTYSTDNTDNINNKKGFTIRTTGTAINDLYPVQLLATNNSKSVQYSFPLTDNNRSYLPVNRPINIITEKHIANVGSYGVTKLATVGLSDVADGGLIKDLSSYTDHYTAASTYSISFIYDHISNLTNKINELYGKVNNVKVSSIQLSQTGTWESTEWPVEKTVYAYIYPDNAANTSVKWECINSHTVSGGNNKLVTFSSEDGSGYKSYTTITLKDYGKGTVRCTAQDGSGVYGQFDINAHPVIIDPPVVSDTITATLLYGEGVSSPDIKSEYVTQEQIEKAKVFNDISVNLTSLDNYSEFHCPAYTTSHSLIIRLPYSESNTGSNIYPRDVQFKDTTIQETNNQWRDIGYLNSTQYNEQQIKTHYTSTYSYFVLTSYEPGKSDYRVNFTKVKPNYGPINPPAQPPTGMPQ